TRGDAFFLDTMTCIVDDGEINHKRRYHLRHHDLRRESDVTCLTDMKQKVAC
ncbi:hypothetical protein HN51_050531, partial [Arachis hypogaea]